MMKKYLFPLLLLSFIACKKGDPGPAGSEGAAGPRGTTGPQGPVGSANVIYSDWLGIELKYGIYGYIYYHKISVPKITQAILDKGDVRMYFKSSVGILPIPSATLPGLYYIFSVGAIELYSPTKWDIVSGYKYRYVIIPGAVSAGNGRSSGPATGYTREALKAMPYEEIARLFNIPETGSNENK